MKSYRVTIKYKQGDQSGVISTTVPAQDERQAIDKVIEANSLAGKVVSRKVELLKLD